jgi:uncharacterized membrane protein YGL010W
MRAIDRLLAEYGESHQNPTNKMVHWICVPLIMFSLLALLYAVPFIRERSLLTNWAAVLLLFAWVYYARLSLPLMIGFVLIGGLMLLGIQWLYVQAGYAPGKLALWAVIIFAAAWVGQFWGHKVEGKKPSFLKDVQFLLIGPAWLMHFVFKRIGVGY